MASHTEKLDGGLVTSQSEVLLAPGELAKCDNAAYRGTQEGLFSIPIKDLAGVNTSANIYGIRPLIFDDGSAYFAIQMVAEYKYASISSSMTFASLPGSTTGTAGPFNTVQMGNRYFLLNGITNYVVSQGPTARAMGMSAVTGSPGAHVVTGVFSLSTTGWYEYWVTENSQYTENSNTTYLESSFSGNPATVQVTATATQCVAIQRPDVVNTGSVSWTLYRAGPKQSANDILFPVGFALATVSTGETTFKDSTGTTLAWAVATATASPTDFFTTAVTAVTISDNIYASALSGTSVGNWIRYHTTNGYFGATPAVVEPISGIQIQVEGHTAIAAGNTQKLVVYVQLSWDGGTTYSEAKGVPVFGTTDATFTVPASSTDPWQRRIIVNGNYEYPDIVWTAAMLNDTNFRVKVTAHYPASAVGQNFAVDQIRCQAYYNGSPGSATETPFPGYTIEVGGAVIRRGSHFPPPVATCGDVFEDRLVVNDVSNVGIIRYSLAGSPEYFPPDYYVPFETSENDTVNAIHTVGDRLVVLLNNSLYRVNYLPTESDVGELNRGRAIEVIALGIGTLNRRSSALFRNHAGQLELAFVSQDGLYATDGYAVRLLSKDLNWENIKRGFPQSFINYTFLKNNPVEHELLMYYPIANAGGAQRCLRFNYHPRHIKQGELPKISGPESSYLYSTAGTAFSISDQALARIPSGLTQGTPYLFETYLGGTTNSQVYARYYPFPPTVNPVDFPGDSTAHRPDIRTRRIYLSGAGSEWKLNGLHLNRQSHQKITGSYGDETVIDGTNFKTDSFNAVALPSKTMAIATTANSTVDGLDVISQVSYQQMCEGVQFQLHHLISGTVGSLDYPWFRYDSVTIDGEDFGDEDSGL